MQPQTRRGRECEESNPQPGEQVQSPAGVESGRAGTSDPRPIDRTHGTEVGGGCAEVPGRSRITVAAVTRDRGMSQTRAPVPSKVTVSSSRWECSVAAALPSASPVEPLPAAASSFISTSWGAGGGGGSCSPPGGGFALSAPRRRAEPSCFMAPGVAA